MSHAAVPDTVVPDAEAITSSTARVQDGPSPVPGHRPR